MKKVMVAEDVIRDGIRDDIRGVMSPNIMPAEHNKGTGTCNL